VIPRKVARFATFLAFYAPVSEKIPNFATSIKHHRLWTTTWIWLFTIEQQYAGEIE